MSLNHSQIALVELPATLAAAFARFISDAVRAKVTIYERIDDIIGDNDTSDIIITDTRNFISHLDFYLPRKGKTAILCDSRGSDGRSFPVTILALDDSPEDNIRKISEIIDGDDEADIPAGHSLTLREIEVLRCIANGLTNKEVADRLNISVNTVITHRKNLTHKLGIRSASGLSLYALMNGLL